MVSQEIIMGFCIFRKQYPDSVYVVGPGIPCMPSHVNVKNSELDPVDVLKWNAFGII